MTEGEHSGSRTQKRGAQSVPRFIVALAIVGVVALVAALVAVVVMPGAGSDPEATVNGASEESTGEAVAADTDGTGSTDETTGVGVGPGGPSAAELAAQSAGDLAVPTEPCGEGVELPVLDAPPPSTLGLLALPAAFEVAELEVTFSPYGWGQGGPEGCNLVIKVATAKPISGDTEDLEDISGMNVSAWTECAHGEILETGGQFAGTVEVRRQGNVGLLYLTGLSRD